MQRAPGQAVVLHVWLQNTQGDKERGSAIKRLHAFLRENQLKLYTVCKYGNVWARDCPPTYISLLSVTMVTYKSKVIRECFKVLKHRNSQELCCQFCKMICLFLMLEHNFMGKVQNDFPSTTLYVHWNPTIKSMFILDFCHKRKT